MKENLKDVITDVFAILLWIAGCYFFFWEKSINIWVFAGIILAGILLLGLSIKQLSCWAKKIANIFIKKKLG
jgi:hypothetical protein